MCGIAGLIGAQSPERQRSLTGAMTDAMARRGPDSTGYHQWPGVAFGHRRLAILDLSPAGAQPMLSPDGEVGVVFNGCIYNFHEIRADLEKSGRVFHSHCDTEILIEGYREWGIDRLLSRLRGMFAFAIWDQPRRTLTMARDRLGVKPLFYRNGKEGFAFASTLGALRAAGLTDELEPQAIVEFLEFGFVTGDRCIYTGPRKLPPATVLEWRNGQISERRYWDLPAMDESSPIGFDEAVERTEELLLESVRLRLVSDVPVGALLSGGIDSTLVCWALGKLNAPVRTYTIGTPGEADDESAAAASIAKSLGVPHQIVPLSPAQNLPIDELLDAYDEPFASQSAMGILSVCRTVKAEATVLLTGDGGDDVFLGYPFFANAWKATQLARSVHAATADLWGSTRPLVDVAAAAFPIARRARNFLDCAFGGIGAYARLRRGLPYFVSRGLFGERLACARLPEREVPASIEAARRLLADVSLFHRRMHFTSEFMTKVDSGAMHYSIESRAPLLDHRLWEFAVRLPPSIHFHCGELKAVLREIVRRRVSAEIAGRSKQGFTVPVEHWLAGRWSSRLGQLRGETLLAKQGWMRQDALDAAVSEAVRGGKAEPQLWYALVLENWLRRWRANG